MKKLVLLITCFAFITSCDPVSVMEANINNATSQSLSIVFVSSQAPEQNKTLELSANTTVLFQEGMSTTGGFLEPYLLDYDSVYIQNASQEVLKIFKQGTIGKSIYSIDDHWTFSEPSKRVYEYDFDITSQDLE